MKILHTADLHLGRKFGEESLILDQKHILKEIIRIIIEEKIDLLLLAGDVFDRSNPSEEAVSLWENFMLDISQIDIPMLVIPGNHDSRLRLSYASSFLKQEDIWIKGNLEKIDEPFVFKKDDKVVHIYMIPFVRPSDVRNSFEAYQQTDFNSAFQFLINQIHLKENVYNVLMLHQFILYQGQEPELSEAETAYVGGLDSIDASMLEKFDYVAMGHIHKNQAMGKEFIRYSGSPLKYSFSESNHSKSVTVINLKESQAEYSFIPIQPLRDVRVIEGPFESLYQIGLENPSIDLIHAKILDQNALYNAAERLREVYPNLISLEFNLDNKENKLSDARELIKKDPLDLMQEFFEAQNKRPMTDGEYKIMQQIYKDIKE